MPTAETTADAVERHRLMRQEFFAQIGMCVTTYQQVEDCLPGVFTATFSKLHGDAASKQALTLFNLIWKLETKLDAITEAVSDADHLSSEMWLGIRKRVKAAADIRAAIAHSGARLNVYNNISFSKPAEMELHKAGLARAKSIKSASALGREYDKLSKLFLNVVGFELRLRGKTVPPEFLTE